MDEKRMQEIALVLVRIYVRHQPVRLLRNEIRRKLGEASQESGILLDELAQFAKTILSEAFTDAFRD